MVEAFVAVGSNVDRERSVRDGVAALRAAFGSLRVSTVWDNPAVDLDGEPFLNLVVAFQTALGPREVAAALDAIERRFGRPRVGGRKLLARTLDLDLLLHGDTVCNEPGLRLPRDDVTRYAFVLAPLAELAPGRTHPVIGKTFMALWEGFEGERGLVRFELDLG